jgi:hypothetical protein
MATKYYDSFHFAEPQVVSELVFETGVQVVDARVCANDDLILEIAVGDESPEQNNLPVSDLLALAAFFQTDPDNVYVSDGYKDGIVVVEVLEQKRYRFEPYSSTWRKEAFDAGYERGLDDGLVAGRHLGEADAEARRDTTTEDSYVHSYADTKVDF